MRILAAIMVLALSMSLAPSAFAQSPPAPAAQVAAPKIVIYHAEGRRSERIVWLC